MTDSNDTAAALVAVVVMLVALALELGVYLWYAAALAKLFSKSGVESWRGWVPVLNEAEVLRLGGQAPWAVVFFFIPVVNIYGIVLRIMAAHRINLDRGRGAGFTVLAALLPPVWATLLAWGRAPIDDAEFQNRVSAGLAGAPTGPLAQQLPAPAGDSAPSGYSGYGGFGGYSGTAPAVPVPVPPAPAAAPTAPPAPVPVPLSASDPAPAEDPVPDPYAIIEQHYSSAPVTQMMSVVPAAVPVPEPAVVPEREPEPVQEPVPERAPEPEPQPVREPEPEPVPEPKSVPAPVPAASISVPEGLVPPRPEPSAPAISIHNPFAESAPAPPAASVFAPPGEIAPPPAAPPDAEPEPEPELPVAPPEPAPEPEPEPEPPSAMLEPTPEPAAAAPASVVDDEEDGETVVIDRRPRPRWELALDDGTTYPLQSSTVVLGRRPSGDDPAVQYLAVSDATRTLSKQHARLELGDDGWSIVDLHSTNGVLLGDEGSETQLDAGGSAPVETARFVLGKVGMRVRPIAEAT